MKERIIGATLLVTFAVLVVPVFLDGPPDGGETVSVRVLLPGQAGQDIKTVILERERDVPMPAVSSAQPPARKVVAQPLVQRDPVPVETRREPSPQPPPEQQQVASTTGMWAVQLGSFAIKENAEKLAADLRKQGYAAFLSQVSTSSGKLHRVRIGPQKDRASAAEVAARLLKIGHKGQVLPHP